MLSIIINNSDSSLQPALQAVSNIMYSYSGVTGALCILAIVLFIIGVVLNSGKGKIQTPGFGAAAPEGKKKLSLGGILKEIFGKMKKWKIGGYAAIVFVYLFLAAKFVNIQILQYNPADKVLYGNASAIVRNVPLGPAVAFKIITEIGYGLEATTANILYPRDKKTMEIKPVWVFGSDRYYDFSKIGITPPKVTGAIVKPEILKTIVNCIIDIMVILTAFLFPLIFLLPSKAAPYFRITFVTILANPIYFALLCVAGGIIANFIEMNKAGVSNGLSGKAMDGIIMTLNTFPWVITVIYVFVIFTLFYIISRDYSGSDGNMCGGF